MQITNGQGIQELVGFQEVIFGLSGESNNDIHANAGIRHARHNGLDAIGKQVTAVTPLH